MPNIKLRARIAALIAGCLIIVALAAVSVPSAMGLAAPDGQDPWAALRAGGHVAVMRHALAPGTGDPDAFTLGDCRTQRNLSARGRAQAVQIGRRFRENGIAAARVFSSQWCRCRDTAEILDLGPVKALPALNSFFERPESRAPQMQALRDWLKRRDFTEPHILVTHQVNITALTGVYPRSGELVIIRPSAAGDVKVIGTIATDW